MIAEGIGMDIGAYFAAAKERNQRKDWVLWTETQAVTIQP
jgi:hypothetical protein